MAPPTFSSPPETPGTSLVQIGSAEEQVSRAHPASRHQGFQPLPNPTGRSPYRRSLNTILGETRSRRLKGANQISFHVIGDTGGVKYPVAQQLVADIMDRDFADPKRAPAFCYHVGDVVYYNGQRSEYYSQFYEPYRDYQAPIVAIPGNHDGEPLHPEAEPSLEAFVRTFCAKKPELLAEAQDAPRTTMVEPNVYWTLEAALFTIIGLYTNVPEGGKVADDQLAWFVNEVEKAPTDRALLVALHHPPLSADAHHGGSERMGALLDGAFKKATRLPDLILTGHVHNYQRFTRTIEKRELPYLVVGASGYWHLHNMAKQENGADLATPWTTPDRDVVLESYCADRHGFLRLTVDKETIIGEYTTVPRPQESWSRGPVTIVDSFRLDLREHGVSTQKG